MNRFCKYCGEKLSVDNGEYHICRDCAKFKHLKLYKKLGISTNRGLRQSYLQSFEILKHLYFEEKLSVIEIYKKTGVCHKTLKNIFRDFNTSLRSLEEGQKVAVEQNRTSPTSSKRYHYGVHTTWEGLKVFYRSSYELKYATELDTLRIPYRMEAFRVRYWNSEKDRYCVAIPDFYLPSTNEIVEIKSKWTYKEQEMKDKFEEYRKLGYIPKLILEGIELAL